MIFVAFWGAYEQDLQDKKVIRQERLLARYRLKERKGEAA